MENTVSLKATGTPAEISIIVPVYKAEKYLNDCIDSVLEQTFPELEVILVDDGSPDHCPALCDAAAEKDSRIRVIHKPNGGLSSARNAGLNIARGNWVAFVDADDLLLPQAMEKAHRKAEETGADVVMYAFQFSDENGEVYPGWDTIVYDEVISRQELYNRLVIGMYQSMCNKLYRRRLFDGLRFPEGKRFEDTYTSPLLCERVRTMAGLPDSLYNYRQVPGSITHSGFSVGTLDRVEACYRMFLAMYEHHAETLCEAYRTILTGLVDIWWHLTPEERKSPRMKECIGYERDARHKLFRAHGVTLQAISDTILYTRSPSEYLARRRERLAERKDQT